MAETGTTRVLKNSAREGVTLHSDRFRLLSRILSRDELALTIPTHLMRRLVLLRSGWKLLDFSSRDWDLIRDCETLIGNKADNLVNLALAYIVENHERVQRLIFVSQAYSDALLTGVPIISSSELPIIDEIDSQSVLMLKVEGALNHGNHQKYADYLRGIGQSRWIRQRFTGPAVFHALNTPLDNHFDTFLSYMLPQDDTGGVERAVVRHILRDDLSFNRSLAYRACLGFYVHPFDALESFTNHFEVEVIKYGNLSPQSSAILERLANQFPGSRIERLRDYLKRRLRPDPCDYRSWSYAEGRLPRPIINALNAFVEVDSVQPSLEGINSEVLRSLLRMRWSLYPEESDFDAVTGSMRAYGFLEAGRLISALMTSMYMVPREAALTEGRQLLRLHSAAGRTTPYVWGAPRGDQLMRAQMNTDPRGWLGADLKAGATLAKRRTAEDRTWFHSSHWELRKAEKSLHVRQWLATVRNHFPVLPRYLTGIDWTWIERVLPTSRVTPFRDNPNGPFALLLRDIEEGQRDSTLLRTAIEPMAADVTCPEFVDRLINEYDGYAVAFVRYFLSAETIMLLSLAPNMTAALSERIAALETCAAKFQFGPLLSEEELRLEQQALTASVMLLSVNANQFDVPWATFKRDAGERQRDNYNMYVAMSKADKTLSAIIDADILFSHQFSNGHTVDYVLKNSTVNLSLFVLGVIDAFYDHPSYGIEAILSTRFRHDTLRREFSSELSNLKTSYIQGVMPQAQRVLVDKLSDICLAEIDAWLVRRMQTIRPGHSEALFDFTPKPDDLARITAEAGNAKSFEEAIEVVIVWLIARLDVGLSQAQKSFHGEFQELVSSAIQRKLDHLKADDAYDPTVLSRVHSAVLDTFTRTSEMLSEWLRRPENEAQRVLTFEQIKLAVDGRFESDILAKRISVALRGTPLCGLEIPAEHVKLFFDLQSEVLRNAMKYSKIPHVRVHIREYLDSDGHGLVFSSRALGVDGFGRDVAGHQYRSLSDAIFREGNSGIEKIASLAASIYGNQVTIQARGHRKWFHLKVPLYPPHGEIG